MYDVIVVGARCAGSPTALLLSRLGYRVLLLDRATFPSDTISSHVIGRAGLAYLKQWGLYETVLASNCPEIFRRSQALGDFPLTGTVDRAENGLPSALCPRRTVLDKILVDAAVRAGAELREKFSAQELLWDGDRVVGVKESGPHGPTFSETARLVIGADGKHSIVARAVRAPAYQEVPPLLCWYYSYWDGLQDAPLGGMYMRNQRRVYEFATNDGLTMLIVCWPHSELGTVRRDIEGNFFDTVENVNADLGERLRAAKRVERFYGMADLPNFFRKPYGPGWALVGDAGHHKDPVSPHGITNAFRDAALLAKAVDAGLSSTEPMDEALERYEAERNAAAFPLYDQTRRNASFAPPSDEELQIRAALREGPQEDIDLYLSARSEAIPRERFFNPENLARILGKAEAVG